MVVWKNLMRDSPKDSCHLCVKVGLNMETYYFKRHSDHAWELSKDGRDINPARIPVDTKYINLDMINDETQCESKK